MGPRLLGLLQIALLQYTQTHHTRTKESRLLVSDDVDRDLLQQARHTPFVGEMAKKQVFRLEQREKRGSNSTSNIDTTKTQRFKPGYIGPLVPNQRTVPLITLH